MKKILRWIFAFLGILFSIFLFTNIYKVLLSTLEVSNSLNKDFGHIIFVPGGGVKKNNNNKYTMGNSTRERIKLAIQYYKKKNIPILISGSSLYKKSPIRKEILDLFSNNGVLKKHIIFESKSTTTFENIKNLKNFLKINNYKEILICTSPYHQKRIKKMLDYFKINNYKFLKMPFSEIYKADNIKSRLRNIKLIFREYLAIIKFSLFKK